ncbi:alpha-mannosidase [Rhodotorula paludigena]|uniref:alpha-mannosidase n=1 Tax=Rhodotorula paludigena TaxID=86838 RepID=UPI0031807EBD
MATAPASAKPLYPIVNHEPRAVHFRGLTLGRLDQFEGGKFPNITDVLFEHRSDDEAHIQLEYWSSPGREKTPFKEAVRQHFKPAHKGIELGPSWTNHWFRVTIHLPAEWKDAERIQLEFDPSCEAMVFDTEGCPLQGLTGGFAIDRRVEFILPKDKRASGYKYYIETSCNAMFGNGLGETNGPPDNNRYFRLNSADLVVPRMEAWRLLWDFRVIRDLARNLPERSPLGNKCLEVGNAIMNTFRSSDLSTIAASRALAARVFGGPEWEKEGADVYRGDPGESGVASWAIGNCHIDTGWLWPFSVTRQKTARSWSTQLDLMERYPEHRFVASQAQQFKWLEQDYPLLFQKIKGKVQSGQFLPIGGMWVESDQLLPSGESLARQFIYGQRYFKSRFGSYCRTFWLPDSFGYNAAAPQIARLAGLDFFFTQKTSWSQFNEFPNTSFRWEGQDKTQILVHLCPQNTYTAQASVEDVLNTWRNHKSLQSGAQTGLLTYGNGDGGGGPLAPMLETLRRCRAIANDTAGGGGEIPKVHMGATVEQFYEDVLKKSEKGERLPTWTGELYLELHRGTATSHGSMKRNNRKTEILLHDLEYVATLASVFPSRTGAGDSASAYRYPKDELDKLWEDMLLLQFHDVLPGSAIGMVYEDAEKIYADVTKKANALLESALSALIPHSTPLSSAELPSSSAPLDALVALDPLSPAQPRRELVKVPLAVARALEDAAVQRSHDGEAYVLFEGTEGVQGQTVLHKPVGAMEIAERGHVLAARARTAGDNFVLSTPKLKVTVTPSGRISSIYDKEVERELILEGRTAGFVIFQDTPLNWDAWDVDAFHLETKKEVNATSVEVVEDGPLRSSLLVTYHLSKSVVKATISLDAAAPSTKADALSLLRFDVQVDWHERHEFLKWEIPLAITPTGDVATYENQFGFCQRSTHRNTTWQRAQFEVCGHRYADVSEFGYGVALLNDSKYGHACEGSTLRLSLLRAATIPDDQQDQGSHQFSFAVLPHRGSFAESDVPAVARFFNYPLHLRRLPSSSLRSHASALLASPQGRSPFTLSGARNIVLDTIKRGEDDHFSAAGQGDGTETVVLRLYEAYGGGAGGVKVEARLPKGKSVVKAEVTDLLERPVEDLSITVSSVNPDSPATNSIALPRFRAFQIVTVRLTLA